MNNKYELIALTDKQSMTGLDWMLKERGAHPQYYPIIRGIPEKEMRVLVHVLNLLDRGLNPEWCMLEGEPHYVIAGLQPDAHKEINIGPKPK